MSHILLSNLIKFSIRNSFNSIFCDKKIIIGFAVKSQVKMLLRNESKNNRCHRFSLLVKTYVMKQKCVDGLGDRQKIRF